MKPFRSTLLFLSLLSVSSAALADCRTFLDGSTYCSGPQGYQASGREYTGGVSEYRDNRGNTATVRQDGFGGAHVYAPTGVVPQVVPVQPYEHQMYPKIYPKIYPE